jgi:para-nitrobenzyl esterase
MAARWILAVLAMALCSAVAQAQNKNEAATVKTRLGQVQGIVENGIAAFKGIPYAAPPIGNMRWREPKPAAPWSGLRQANAYSAACIQVPGLSAENGGDPGRLSEDCLYLNIWTPRADHLAKLPVIVWIHGGAYVFGAGGLPVYDGQPMAKKGAVFVSVNYRLAQLGFFAHPALEKENPGGVTNFGLLDQITALKWVQANIAAFGGDPGNVTIMGQSAGGKSVLALYASPLARGLFHKGVAMSSYVVPDTTRAKALEVGTKVADALGLNGAKATAAELRAVPAERFGPIKGQGLSNAPVPIRGDKVLPQSIESTFAAGREAAVPLIVGNTSNDSSVVAAFGIDAGEVLKRLGAAGFLVKVLYPGVKDDADLARQVARDLVFTMPVRAIADRHAKRAPTWRYYFDYVTVKQRPDFANGVGHGAEIPYFLDTGDIFEGTRAIFTDADRALARRASDYLFAFARDGRPSAPGAPPWPSDTRVRDRTMVFSGNVEVERRFMRARLNVMIGASKIAGRLLARRK